MQVTGAFSKLLGHIELELVQSLRQAATKNISPAIGGLWVYSSLFRCIKHEPAAKRKSFIASVGYSFTVGGYPIRFEAQGASAERFCYVEDLTAP
jgi:hypothetical protein